MALVMNQFGGIDLPATVTKMEARLVALEDEKQPAETEHPEQQHEAGDAVTASAAAAALDLRVGALELAITKLEQAPPVLDTALQDRVTKLETAEVKTDAALEARVAILEAELSSLRAALEPKETFTSEPGKESQEGTAPATA